MIKNIIIVFLACAFIACKTEENEAVLDVKGAIKTDRLVEDFTCDNTTYVFQIPFYQGNSDIENRLNKDIKDLITQSSKNVNYDNNADLKEIWDLFIKDRERKICAGDKSGMNHIVIEHLSQNDAFISYELSYSMDGSTKRITKTFKKPELKELKIIDIAKPDREVDVRRIFDINLQQSVANLSLEIKPEDYENFRDFIESKAILFSKEEFEQATLGVKELGKDSLILQVSKKIELPAKYSNLNEDIKVEISAQEMDYYLDLSSLKF